MNADPDQGGVTSLPHLSMPYLLFIVASTVSFAIAAGILSTFEPPGVIWLGVGAMLSLALGYVAPWFIEWERAREATEGSRA